MNDVPSGDADCVVLKPLFCNLYKNAGMANDATTDVTGVVNKFTESDMVKQYKDNSSSLNFLHILPYPLVIAALFFFGFWYKDGTCCCCKGGSCAGCCCFLLPFCFFWLIFFVVNTIFVGLCSVVVYMQDDIPIPGVAQCAPGCV